MIPGSLRYYLSLEAGTIFALLIDVATINQGAHKNFPAGDDVAFC